MTITERNQQQYNLRQEMYNAQQKAEFYKQQIARLNMEYQAQFETPLFDQMFGG